MSPIAGFFVFGFPKNERSNIDQDEKEALKKLSSELLSLTAEAIETAKLKDELIEVISNLSQLAINCKTNICVRGCCNLNIENKLIKFLTL
ncbi:type II toxin-antitoxin system RelE/ParE family toxin [Sphaerospermopsis aphanizomenoides]|uniref:type II toxin-antitoxin system RelE/ParE family toxin n=1 Tax=Sphaerospermopsis aphanizomenoides TaxID=459663 RepID=UPI000A79D185|nr:type II toxin-antitoxin system RelE/ParE family toxin [Sphaerospermopsis aphanizomenoides]